MIGSVKMRTGRQQVTLQDLVDEAKKRNVFLFVSSVGLSYLMSYILDICLFIHSGLQIIWMVCRKSDFTFIRLFSLRHIISGKSNNK
ncbi:hypothetical protein Hanom_Chr11g01037451 [Helianthus anomalus]